MSKFILKYPLKSVFINQDFGENRVAFYKEQLGLKGHNGTDFAAPDGTPVYAAHDGEVTFTGEDNSGGLGVVIRTFETFNYNGEQVYMKSIYWHLKKNSFKVKPGDKVKSGDLIALADNTGMSTGSHLHFGLKPVQKGEADWSWTNLESNNGYNGAIDPAPYFIFQFTKDLFLGSKSSDVRNLQSFLVSQGYTIKDAPTTYFGLQTRSALAQYQKANDIFPSVGYFGPVTRKKINEMLAK